MIPFVQWVPPETSPTSGCVLFVFSTTKLTYFPVSSSCYKTETWCECGVKSFSNRCLEKSCFWLLLFLLSLIDKKDPLLYKELFSHWVNECPRSDWWVLDGATIQAAWLLLGNFWVFCQFVFGTLDISPWQPYIRERWVSKTSTAQHWKRDQRQRIWRNRTTDLLPCSNSDYPSNLVSQRNLVSSGKHEWKLSTTKH